LLAPGVRQTRKSGDGSELHAAGGQVKPAQSKPVTHYAAARFADQVSFGATPALVAEIEAKGFVKWIDDQYALPVSTVDAAPIKVHDPNDGGPAFQYAAQKLAAAYVANPDQLRSRVAFALSQVIVVSIRKVNPYGTMQYANLMHSQALGNYATLIREVSTSPAMGEYLDNIQNRPISTQCPACQPNENYARELMQLFTLGVVKLKLDGSTERDAQGLPLETYQQKDVEELARALTGWSWASSPQGFDQGRYDGKLVPDSAAAHDRGAKKVLGSDIAANGDANADLDAAVKLLVAHQNTAPFVSLRLIQHLVTSDPTPAYVTRVATVFRNNGQGVVGDMKALVKAVLLDPEARRGDVPGADTTRFGKMREPWLWYTGLLRGMGCTAPIVNKNGDIQSSASQAPFNAESVFSFYAATDRAPGSNLLAPEQKLLNASELSGRLWGMGIKEPDLTAKAGCKAAPLAQAYSSSPAAFADLVSELYFRGAMPVVLRQNLIDLAPEVYGLNPQEKAMGLLLYALSTPYYGVIR
jgi:uncharacterized protein (DUF1800 family)